MTDETARIAALDELARLGQEYDAAPAPDEELIARLRDKNCCESPNCNCDAAADRLEALRRAVQHANDHADAAIKDMEALVKEREDLIHDLERIKASETEQLNRAERLEAALREIESITVHSGGEIHGVNAAQWKLAFEQAQDEARAALTQKDRTDV